MFNIEEGGRESRDINSTPRHATQSQSHHMTSSKKKMTPWVQTYKLRQLGPAATGLCVWGGGSEGRGYSGERPPRTGGWPCQGSPGGLAKGAEEGEIKTLGFSPA